MAQNQTVRQRKRFGLTFSQEGIQQSHINFQPSTPDKDLNNFIINARIYHENLLRHRELLEEHYIGNWDKDDWNAFYTAFLVYKPEHVNNFLTEITTFQKEASLLQEKINGIFNIWNVCKEDQKVSLLYIPCYIFHSKNVVCIPLIKVLGKKLLDGNRKVYYVTQQSDMYDSWDKFLDSCGQHLPHSCMCLPHKGRYPENKKLKITEIHMPLDFLNIMPPKSKNPLINNWCMLLLDSLVSIPIIYYFDVDGMQNFIWIIASRIFKYIPIDPDKTIFEGLATEMTMVKIKKLVELESEVKNMDFAEFLLELQNICFPHENNKNSNAKVDFKDLSFLIDFFKNFSQNLPMTHRFGLEVACLRSLEKKFGFFKLVKLSHSYSIYVSLLDLIVIHVKTLIYEKKQKFPDFELFDTSGIDDYSFCTFKRLHKNKIVSEKEIFPVSITQLDENKPVNVLAHLPKGECSFQSKNINEDVLHINTDEGGDILIKNLGKLKNKWEKIITEIVNLRK